MLTVGSRIALLLTIVAPGVAAACPVSTWEKADLELVRPVRIDLVADGIEQPKGATWGDDARIEVRAHSLIGDLGPFSEARAVVRDGCATLTWPSWPEYYLRPNTPFMATICAEGASGNRSCYRDVLYPTPRASERPPEKSNRLHILVRRVPLGEVVEAPPEEPLPRAALLQSSLPWWRIAGLVALAVLLAVAVALGRVRIKRAIRRA